MSDLTHMICKGKHTILRGDASSVAVIFNNMTGANFREPRIQCLFDDLKQYLNFMNANWKAVPVQVGDQIDFCTIDGISLLSATIGALDAPRVTAEIIARSQPTLDEGGAR